MKYFTIDLEEWWGVESFKSYYKKNPIPADDRIGLGLNSFLFLLEKYNQSATFFILGRVAEKYPDLVLSLIAKGHQIATHGYNHELVYKQTPAEFERDLLKSLEILAKQTGKDITAYRAPSYSITSKSLWAIELLRKNGITLDSSISPAANKRFGIPGAPEHPYAIETGYGIIKEQPPNVLKLGLKLPITSGIGFRLFPSWLINLELKKHAKQGVHSMFIFHNWEMDENQPVIDVNLKSRFIHYHGISNMKKKVEQLLVRHQFEPLTEENENLNLYSIFNGNLERTI